MFTPVIMAGGSGTRLWPLSRGNFPKQFLPLTGRHTMLQQTLLRLGGLQKPQGQAGRDVGHGTSP